MISSFSQHDGKLLWQRDITVNGDVTAGFLKDKILLSDDATLKLFSIDDGRQLKQTYFSESEADHFAFETIADLSTG